MPLLSLEKPQTIPIAIKRTIESKETNAMD